MRLDEELDPFCEEQIELKSTLDFFFLFSFDDVPSIEVKELSMVGDGRAEYEKKDKLSTYSNNFLRIFATRLTFYSAVEL